MAGFDLKRFVEHCVEVFQNKRPRTGTINAYVIGSLKKEFGLQIRTKPQPEQPERPSDPFRDAMMQAGLGLKTS